ncbi:protein kinase domain-containing protein [Lyngbya aestuarii]|uniref:protein kinase domain-containing protein n=1 Tax=Lyngbya aestuarii TaxID=118322 RepID=UPI00403D9510
MEIYCTRPTCRNPVNSLPHLDDKATLKIVQQEYCRACGMPLILNSNYLPTQPLARGALGATFLALDRTSESRRLVVVKQLRPRAELTPPQMATANRLFKREAQVLAQLGENHPQIPTLYAYFELLVPEGKSNHQQEFFYLVQQYINGQDLNMELASLGRFTEVKVVEVLQQILPVLQFVHERGAIHRDIKPANIVRQKNTVPETDVLSTGVPPAGNNGRLYLIDFGAVKQVIQGGTQALTGAARSPLTIVGTPGFAPQEQISVGAVSPSADLYSLAVTCLCLLTGQAEPNSLYDADNNAWDWRSHVEVSDELAAVLDRMLLPKPSARFRSADGVIAHLFGDTKTQPSLTYSPDNSTPEMAHGQELVTLMSAAEPESSSKETGNNVRRHQVDQLLSQLWSLEIWRQAVLKGAFAYLLAITIISFLGTFWISTGFWLLIFGASVFAQYRPLVEKVYFFTITVTPTLLVSLFFPYLLKINLLQSGMLGLLVILLMTCVSGLLVFILMALSQLIYRLISAFFDY